MVLRALSLSSSSSSLSFLTIKIGGTGEAIAVIATTATTTTAAAAAATPTTTTKVTTTTVAVAAATATVTITKVVATTATTGATAAAAVSGYDKRWIDCDDIRREHIPSEKISISSSSSSFDNCLNLFNFIMLATLSTTTTSSSSSSTTTTTPASTTTTVTAAAAATITTTAAATTATTTTTAVAVPITTTAIAAAVTSNNLSMNTVAELISTTDDILLDELSSRFHGVLPIQPSPLLLPSDHISSSLKSTRLNGHLIYCFVIGGECRLCFPQIISVVLRDVAINEINELFVNLNIHISVASQQQLETLKLAGVMPMTADSCGLVTKSDAERLVAKLLPQCNGYRLATRTSTITTTTGTGTDEAYQIDAIPVMHDCFDGCTGTLMLMLDTDEQIECTQCKLLFTGEKFVSHSHSIQQIRRICHWGFDSSNWRHYLHLPESYEDDVKALQKLELYKYPPIRLGKRSASHTFTTVENGTCSKVANLMTTTSAKPAEIGTEAEVAVEVGVGNGIDPTIIPTSSMQSVNEFSQHILKLNTAAQTTAVLATALTATSTAPAAVTQNSSILPLQVPVVGANGCYTGQSSVTPLISPQLQSLLALQFVTSQLPLTEPYRPLPTNPSSHITSDIRWKSICETQSSSLSSVPVINSNKSTTDMRQHVIVTDRDFSSKGASVSSTTNLDMPTCTTSKTGTPLERLLDQTLKEPVLSVAKLLAAEFRREKELLLNQNEQLRRENVLLRSALASSTVLVGLKGLNAANVPVP